ncbi:Coiled-coil domain containing protein 109, C-terminal [Artemisia annua]|uniref:Coiled-coil domain containing protein 109, C-terminal n=1 Tax=Artemisia annua TaxID=35608 RepID=A0A2U1P3L2_ARTAN|nr:Coiled-coil domain containing protein 109, C-terminal [Artemisia annua]
MALRQAITKRLLRNQTPANREQTPFSYLSSHKALNAANFHNDLMTSPKQVTPNGDVGFFKRFLQRRKINQSSSLSVPELFSFPLGEKLREKMNISNKERLRFDGLRSPRLHDHAHANVDDSVGISVNDAKKILRFSQLQKVRLALKQIKANSVSYDEFVSICIDTCNNHDQGVEYSKMLDEAGDVIVLGNVVFIRPGELAKSMEKLISQSIVIPNDPRKQQLEELERQKAFIDQKALSQVRGELYAGLGFLVLQTLAFMRLTFWELSWDVMEPICFFVTSFHFALAYTFFLKTSKEPTFEGFFQRRFKTKQKKLMDIYNFDHQNYNELCKVFYPCRQNSFAVSSEFHDSSRGGNSNTIFG